MKKDKGKFLVIETTVRNRKGKVLYFSTSLIPEGSSDYNVEIDRYGLNIKYSK